MIKDTIVDGFSNAPHRSLYHALGLTKEELERLVNVETNKVNDIGEWRGQNNIGKILMICRDCLIEGVEPEIDYGLLDRSGIFLFGERLTFVR